MRKKKVHIKTGSSVAMAMDVIESNKLGAVVIVESSFKPIGLATDGDIRRFLLSGGTIDQEIDACMNSNFTFAEQPLSREKLLKILDNGFACVPVVDEFGVLVDLVNSSTIDYSPESRMFVRARAPVRLSLSGGGSDLTSYMQKMDKGAVLQASVNLYVRCTMKPLSGGMIKYTSIDFNSQYEFKNLEDLMAATEDIGLLKSILEVIEPHFGFELIVGSDVRPKSGLGGSSAYVVAILGCFNELRNDKWTNKELVELAFKIERIHFGNVGGWQDQYAAVYGGINYIEFTINDNQIFPLRVPENTIIELEECLLLCDLGDVHDSNSIQGELQKNIKSSQNISAIQANVETCLQMKQALLEGEFLVLADLLNKTWEVKRTFSKEITTNEIDNFYERCLASGALGGKLLGAGGAGFFLLFVNPAERFKLLNELAIIGVKAHPVNISQLGLKTWSLREKTNG